MHRHEVDIVNVVNCLNHLIQRHKGRNIKIILGILCEKGTSEKQPKFKDAVWTLLYYTCIFSNNTQWRWSIFLLDMKWNRTQCGRGCGGQTGHEGAESCSRSCDESGHDCHGSCVAQFWRVVCFCRRMWSELCVCVCNCVWQEMSVFLWCLCMWHGNESLRVCVFFITVSVHLFL